MIISLEGLCLSLQKEQDKTNYGRLVYEYCCNVNWEETKLEQLGKNIGMNIKQIRQIAFSYFDKVYDKYSKALYYYEKLYFYCKDVDWDLTKIEEYSKRSSYKAEDIIINSKKYIEAIDALISKSYVQKTLEEMELQKEYLTVVNPALLQQKIKTYSIGRNEDERIFTLKYMYNKFILNDNALEELSKEFGLSADRILSYINDYAKKFLKNSLEKNKKAKKFSLVKPVYDKLKNASTLEEIIDTIESSSIKPEYIRKGLHSYLVGYDNYSNYHMLKKKIDLYFEYLSSSKKEIEEFYKYVNMFIESTDISIDEFCHKIGLSENQFRMNLEVLKECNQPLYEKYLEKLESDRKKMLAINETKIRNIIFLMKNGIEENGVIRPFDLIDYFQNINLSLNEFSYLSNKILSNQDSVLATRFTKSNRGYERENLNFIQNILDEERKINYQYDENRMLIEGSGEIFDNERKMRIINYLKEINVPINDKTYSLIYRRYKNGMLELDEDKKIKSRK